MKVVNIRHGQFDSHFMYLHQATLLLYIDHHTHKIEGDLLSKTILKYEAEIITQMRHA